MTLDRLFITILLTVVVPLTALAQEHKVYYAQGSEGAPESSFPFQVLKLGLSQSGAAYVLEPSPIGKANSKRTTDAMVADGPIDVQWVGSSVMDDQKMLPVLFPIDMGLLGYRVFLIDGARQSEFDQINTLSDLQKMVALQGVGWPDVNVLRSAGLRVRTGPSYRDLFRMTVGGRADYFPRGAFEAYNEKRHFEADAPGLAVENSLLLHYPFSTVFYVRKSDKRLHDDLYRGLVAAFDNGSYQALFRNNPDVQTVIAEAHLKTRRVINIDNPFISSEMKAINKRFWYEP